MTRANKKRRAPAKRKASPARARAKTLGSGDAAIAASCATLASLGLVMVYSASAPLALGQLLPSHAVRHFFGICAAALGAVVVSRVPLAFWRRSAGVLWAIGAAGLALTLVVGIEANGARRWLAVPGLPLSLQAAEFAKWATVIAVAVGLARGLEDRGKRLRCGRLVLGLTLLPVALLVLQPDFGSAVILVGVIGLMLFAGGLAMSALLGAAGVATAGGLLYIGLHPYALARVRGFFDPWQTASSEGFQLVQSFVAFGRGGGFGVGLGDGRQKLFYLPEAHTDFILSVVAEELGLAGVLVVLAGFAALSFAGLRVARRAREPFALLMATGMTALVAVPAAVNAAVVMGMLPTTGLALPLLSYGNNAMFATALALGVLLRIARHEAAPQRVRSSGAAPRGLR